MRRYRFTYFLGQSIKGLWRNGIMTVASITVLLSCLVVMGSFGLLIFNLNINLESLGLLNEIVVFIDETKTPEEVAAIGEEIAEITNVSEVIFTSKDQALEEERQKYSEYSGLYDLVEGDNPLRDEFTIKYKDNSSASDVVYALGKIPGIDKINSRLDLAMSIEKVKNSISLTLLWFMAILFTVSVFVIINTIKLAVHARRTEITIMRYVGATEWFVMLPFIFEGIAIGLVSSALAFGVQWYIYGYVIKMMEEGSFDFITVVGFGEIGWIVGLIFLGIGVVTGIIGSTISTGKYLKA